MSQNVNGSKMSDLMYSSITLTRSIHGDQGRWFPIGTRAVIVHELAPGKAWVAEVTIPCAAVVGDHIYETMGVSSDDFDIDAIYDVDTNKMIENKKTLERWEQGCS